MKTIHHHGRSGIALIMVMLIVVVFAILAGGLAYTMKVETKLARNSSWDTELEWLGRSGIELARYVLAQPNQAGQPYDGLNQIWAGGTGETNDALMGISLTDNQLGHGRFSVKITDADRKFNVNLAAVAPEILDQGLILMGVMPPRLHASGTPLPTGPTVTRIPAWAARIPRANTTPGSSRRISPRTARSTT